MRLFATLILATIATPAMASAAVPVPEMDAGAAVAAVALLAGAAAIIREKMKRK